MDELVFEIRQQDDQTRETAGRLVGTLLRYEERARDRPEVFMRGALTWPADGIVINEGHQRSQAILRAIPFVEGDEVRIDAPVPATQRGRDLCTNISAGVLTGLSVEFKATSEGRRGNLREIRSAFLGAAAVVDAGAYRGSTVEVRSRGDEGLMEVACRWL